MCSEKLLRGVLFSSRWIPPLTETIVLKNQTRSRKHDDDDDDEEEEKLHHHDGTVWMRR